MSVRHGATAAERSTAVSEVSTGGMQTGSRVS